MITDVPVMQWLIIHQPIIRPINRSIADDCIKLQNAPIIKLKLTEWAGFWLHSSHGSADFLLLSTNFYSAQQNYAPMLFMTCMAWRLVQLSVKW